jgi:hypothetical protein
MLFLEANKKFAARAFILFAAFMMMPGTRNDSS